MNDVPRVIKFAKLDRASISSIDLVFISLAHVISLRGVALKEAPKVPSKRETSASIIISVGSEPSGFPKDLRWERCSYVE